MRFVACLIVICCCAQVRAQVPVVKIRGLAVDFSPAVLVASPGESVHLGMDSSLEVSMAGAPAGAREAGGWLLQVPVEPGLYPLRVSGGAGEMRINLLVTVPATEIVDGRLNGYRMGPAPPGNPRLAKFYSPPTGFIEVTEDMLDLQLTPHFQLRQFLCKQRSGYPKYLALRESLLVLLEGLLGAVRERGYAVDTFGVISAYRTPWYNRKIDNVANSRHVYGDAMDLFVDADGDGKMDDLNRDGRRDKADVELLAGIAEAYMAGSGQQQLHGGVGRYRKNARHGGFVHVDTRGFSARWGVSQ